MLVELLFASVVGSKHGEVVVDFRRKRAGLIVLFFFAAHSLPALADNRLVLFLFVVLARGSCFLALFILKRRVFGKHKEVVLVTTEWLRLPNHDFGALLNVYGVRRAIERGRSPRTLARYSLPTLKKS